MGTAASTGSPTNEGGSAPPDFATLNPNSGNLQHEISRTRREQTAARESLEAQAHVSQMAESLANVLQDPVCVQYFSIHLANEHSVENLDFYESAHIFQTDWDKLVAAEKARAEAAKVAGAPEGASPKTAAKYLAGGPLESPGGSRIFGPRDVPEVPTMPDLLNMAKNLIALYISPSAPMAINLSAKARAKTEASVAEGRVERGTFEIAANEIYQVMSRDSFARFKNTELWAEFKSNHKKLPKDLPNYYNGDLTSQESGGSKSPVAQNAMLAGPDGKRERSHVSKKRVSMWCAGKRNRSELRSFLYATGDFETASVEGGIGGLRVIVLTPQSMQRAVTEQATGQGAAAEGATATT